MSLLGTCQLELLVKAIDRSRHKLTHVLLQSNEHFTIPEPEDDDLVIVNPNLREIMSQASGLPLPASDMVFARLTSAVQADHLLEAACSAIDRFVSRITAVHHETPVIFVGFFEANIGHYGVTIDPYSIQEPREFVRRLNAHLSRTLAGYQNSFFLEMNEILSHIGREFLQDDVVLHTTHSSFINDWDFKLDTKLLSKPKQLLSAINYERCIRKFGLAFIDRIETIYRVRTQVDQIKLIICDLDDTLWRGVAAEADGISDEDRIAGWPLGFVESLLFFKARGGILALCSKNDLADTTVRFDRIFRGALTIADFAVARVNWERKSQSISEILAETNLLAKNSLFIDDNVREVAEVQAKHPDLRCLGVDYYNWRRTILGAPETQVATITDESRQRTALVQATVARLAASRAASDSSQDRQQWLESLELRQSVQVIGSPSGKHYERAFELLNKTNQFNTTGKRWLSHELRRFLSDGGVIYASSLADKTIDNGLIATCLVRGNEIVQMVLSCRVFGLDAEKALGAAVITAILKHHSTACAYVVDTGRNKTCHSYFASLGFTQVGDRFEIDHEVTSPTHIAVARA